MNPLRSKTGRANTVSIKQAVQLLESRRLMSAAVVAPPLPSAPLPQVPPPLVNDFVAFQDAGFAGHDNPTLAAAFAENEPVAGPFQPAPIFGPPFSSFDFENTAIENQFVMAIPRGMQLSIVPTSDADRAGSATAMGTTISALYSTIGTSTVSEVDNAQEKTAALPSKPAAIDQIGAMANIADSVMDRSNANAGADASSPTASDKVSIVASATPTASTLLPILSVRSQSSADDQADFIDVEPSVIASAQPQAGAVSQPLLLSREMLRSIEQDLVAVKDYSRELIWTMGRDQAIAASHAAQTSESPVVDVSLSRWQSAAALIGAAVASVVYAQNEILAERKEQTATFSEKLISAVCS